MGNCAGGWKEKIDDQVPVYGDVHKESPHRENYKESEKGKSHEDDEMLPVITPLRNDDGQDEYFHSDSEGEQEDISEWDIIEYGGDTTQRNGHWNHDRTVSLQTLDMDTAQSRSRRSETRVRFSEYEEQQIYGENIEKSNLGGV